ncbi:Clathrin light chain [Nakaseomyces bracarensis]|uniref:Clathrin light chain n=1 Tax=Nakaseomyces bracarensis TaxID=273131 RepID=A0ABR4NP10_9SACH
MSEKFPPLENENDDLVADLDNSTDFLKREAEVLGDEFKTEQDAELLDDVQDNEVDESLEQKYPEATDVDESVVNAAQSHDLDDDFGEMHQAVGEDRSKYVQDWKEKRDAEIREKDSAEAAAKEKLQDEAIKYIDDFYETYNKKKEQQIDVTTKESEEFLKEREQFFSQDNTTWDRVLQLINVDDADVIGGRDRSKFKEILQRLKGKTGVPGA